MWCINRRTLASLHVLLGCFIADLMCGVLIDVSWPACTPCMAVSQLIYVWCSNSPVTSIIGSSGIVTYLVATYVGSAAILQSPGSQLRESTIGMVGAKL